MPIMKKKLIGILRFIVITFIAYSVSSCAVGGIVAFGSWDISPLRDILFFWRGTESMRDARVATLIIALLCAVMCSLPEDHYKNEKNNIHRGYHNED